VDPATFNSWDSVSYVDLMVCEEAKPGKLVLVSHCILNQFTRAWWGSGGASRDGGVVVDAIDAISDCGAGVIQMECPEFSLYGNPRDPQTKDGYDTPKFRERCQEIAVRACDRVEEMTKKDVDPPIKLMCTLGMEGSPSCGVHRTPREVEGGTRDSDERGHLMVALELEMRRRGIHAPMIGFSLRGNEREESLRKLKELLVSHP
jgi:predicted secreted protein